MRDGSFSITLLGLVRKIHEVLRENIRKQDFLKRRELNKIIFHGTGVMSRTQTHFCFFGLQLPQLLQPAQH